MISTESEAERVGSRGAQSRCNTAQTWQRSVKIILSKERGFKVWLKHDWIKLTILKDTNQHIDYFAVVSVLLNIFETFPGEKQKQTHICLRYIVQERSSRVIMNQAVTSSWKSLFTLPFVTLSLCGEQWLWHPPLLGEKPRWGCWLCWLANPCNGS